MALPLAALLSQVKNNVNNGLKGQQNVSYSDDQVIADLLQGRAGLLKQYSVKGMRIKASSLMQTMPLLPVLKGQLLDDETPGELPGVLRALGLTPSVDRGQPYVELPALLTNLEGRYLVEYLGSLDGNISVKLLYGNDYRYVSGERLSGRWPCVWVNEDRGWLLRCPPTWVALMARAALFDPRDATRFGGRYAEESPVPMPDWLEEELVRTVTNKYISMYGRLNPRPNDGNSAV